MLERLSRRTILRLAAAAAPFHAVEFPAATSAAELLEPGADSLPASDLFPAHPPELVREMVTVAHFDLQRVEDLVSARPSLARAAWDWGFGDWESALGAASHMGNRPIAEYLIRRGARPSLFSAAMLGQIAVVKAFVAAQPGAQRIAGPHSITLLAHARMGGDAARPVLAFLDSLGDADGSAPAPLPEADAAALAGTYVFGVGITQQVELSTNMKMYENSKMYTHAPQLNWTRKGTMTRPLFHLGDRTFYPAGAPSVRIHFRGDGGNVVMSVTDADLQLTAQRKQDAQ